MNTPVAKVIAVDGEQLTLVVDAPIACARCATGKGCGAGLLGQSSASRQFELRRPAGMPLRAGDSVVLSMHPERLLQATLLVYGLPLTAMLVAPLLASAFFGPMADWKLTAASLAGLVLAALAGRRLLAEDRCIDRLVPTISGHWPAAS
ncbi:MAG: SoxR reducing system RseC family protein [Halioglobus sp.]|nr:SoxR reducing system RseC family protein [Halioglobus sp.]